LIDARIIGGLQSHQNLRIFSKRQVFQDLGQILWPDFRGSARLFDLGGQPDLFHPSTPFCKFSSEFPQRPFDQMEHS
jgi:hypothetical protein